MLTDAGRTVLEFARRFENLRQEMENALAELRDNSAGRLTIGANESSTLYLLSHIERYRRLYPKIKVQVRRGQSSKIPAELLDGNLELGVVSYDPNDERWYRRLSTPMRWRSWCRRCTGSRRRKSVSITDLGSETFIAHNVVSPHRETILREFRRHKVPLNMNVEMPTLEIDSQAGAEQRRRGFPAADGGAPGAGPKACCARWRSKSYTSSGPSGCSTPRGRALSHAAQRFPGSGPRRRQGRLSREARRYRRRTGGGLGTIDQL